MRELLPALLLCACAMPTGDGMSELHLPIRGLYTDPSPHTAPKGALSEASNIVIREENEAGPRPGFQADATEVSGRDIVGLYPFDGDVLVQADNALLWDSLKTSSVTSPGTRTANRFFTVEARGNLYANFEEAVRKFEVGGSTVVRETGLRPPAAVESAGDNTSGTAVADSTRVAYVAVIKRQDANGVWRISQPCSRLVYEQTSGGTLDPIIRIYLSPDYPSGAAAGDVLDLYRTAGVANTIWPSYEYGLVVRHEITSADIIAKYYEHTDITPDVDRGEAAYFSPSREGAEGTNFAPPACKDLALYRGSMFFANTTDVDRFQLRFTENDNLTSQANGVGRRNYTGTRSNSSNQITGMSSTVGLKEGMVLLMTDLNQWLGSSPSGAVTITAISGSTLTMSHTWNGTTDGAPVFVPFSDSIRINDGYYPVSNAVQFVRTLNWGTSSGTDGLSWKITASQNYHAYTVGDVLHDVRGTPTSLTEPVQIVIEADDAGNPFTVFATHGDEYYPALPEPFSGGSEQADNLGDDSEADVRPNGISWAKGGEPEHVRLVDYAYVGGEKSELLRAIATREALWLFKIDGVFRLFGFGDDSGWRIDPFDPTLKLLAPKAAVEMDGVIYAWTTKGVVSVSDAGVQQLSDPAIGNTLEAIEVALGAGNTATRGVWMAANPTHNEILLGVPASAGDDVSEAVYVLNTKTFTWTTWDEAWSAAAFDPTAKALRAGGDYGGGYASGAWHYDIEKTDGDWTDFTDYEFSITITDITGNTVTISAGSGWTPAVGDVVEDTGAITVVMAVTSATVFDVLDASVLPEKSPIAYVAYQSCIKWVDKVEGNPAALKRYKWVTPAWTNLQGVYQASVEFTSSRSLTASTKTITSPHPYDLTSATPPTSRRVHVGRNHGRGTALHPRLCIRQGGSQWRLNGLGVTSEAVSGRVSR